MSDLKQNIISSSSGTAFDNLIRPLSVLSTDSKDYGNDFVAGVPKEHMIYYGHDRIQSLFEKWASLLICRPIFDNQFRRVHFRQVIFLGAPRLYHLS